LNNQDPEKLESVDTAERTSSEVKNTPKTTWSNIIPTFKIPKILPSKKHVKHLPAEN